MVYFLVKKLFLTSFSLFFSRESVKLLKSYVEKLPKKHLKLSRNNMFRCTSQIQLSNINLINISIKSNSVNTRFIKVKLEKIAKTRFIQVKCVAAPLKKHIYFTTANFDGLYDLGHQRFLHIVPRGRYTKNELSFTIQ